MVNQLSIFLENRPGELTEITKVLSENQVDMRALNLAETKDYGVLRILADDAAKASSVLLAAGYVLSMTPIVAVGVKNEAGGLCAVLSVLAESNIDISYMYSVLGGGETAYMLFRVEDPQAMEDALTAKGITVATAADLGIK